MSAWNFEEGDSAVSGVRVEHVVEDGLDEQKPEGFEQPDGGHEDDGEQRLQRVRTEIAEETEVFCHPRSLLVAAMQRLEGKADAVITAIPILYPRWLVGWLDGSNVGAGKLTSWMRIPGWDRCDSMSPFWAYRAFAGYVSLDLGTGTAFNRVRPEADGIRLGVITAL